jgi:hypothetical protein
MKKELFKKTSGGDLARGALAMVMDLSVRYHSVWSALNMMLFLVGLGMQK